MSNRRRIVAVIVAVFVVAMAIASPYGYRVWRLSELNRLADQSRVAERSRRWGDLKVLAERWSNLDPSNGEAWLLQGRAAIGRKEWSQAASCFWRIPENDPRSIQAMIEVSRLAFGYLDDPLQGTQACERILRIDPKASGAQKQLIGYYATTLQREKLLRQIQSAIAAQTEPREAYVHFFLLYTVRSNDAVALNDRWLKRTPDDEIFLVARALQLPEKATGSPETPTPSAAAENAPQHAGPSKEEQIDELLSRFPHNIELLAYKADDCIVTGNVAEAVRLLSQATASAGQDSRFWRLKGWIHESNDELDEAEAAYHRALELHATDWLTMIRLAVVERRLQKIDEVQRLTKLVERAEGIRQALRTLSSVELVTPAILSDLANFYQDCGDQIVGPALRHRLESMASP